MRVTWIGQAGLLIEVCNKKIMIDPYLSDYAGKRNPEKHRRVPVMESLLDMTPDVLLFTHDHIDHYDPDTAPHYLQKTDSMLVLAPGTCWQKARQFGGDHNYVLFDRGTQWTEGDVRFTAVMAVHSDEHAIGVVIEAAGKCIYVTGDTLYSSKIFEELPKNIDAVFLPVNGAGNNMNMTDAARFAADCGAKVAVPIHVGMFDDIDPAGFPFENKILPELYKEMEMFV